MSPTEDILAKCSDNDISFVRLLWVGHDGIPRGRTVKATKIDDIIKTGFSYQKAVQALTIEDRLADDSQFGVADEAKIKPDPDTFVLLPYAERTAAMICDATTIENEPWSADPRVRFQEFLTDIDYLPKASFESEFYLLEPDEGGYKPFDDKPNWSVSGMQSAHPVVTDMIDALESQGMELSSYYPEAGPGQQEIVTAYTRGKQSADNFIFYKQTINAVAEQHETRATFMPKPFANEAGSGLHVHLSLWSDDQNAFNDEASAAPYGLSDLAEHFIGGVVKHSAALIALTAPNVNSYRRIQPQSWSSAWACWGEGNREAVVRVPFADISSKGSSMRIEYRAADNTANPYLTLLGILGAGFDGIEKELTAPSIREDPSRLSAGEREELSIQPLPRNLGEALTALEENDVLKETLGEPLFESFLNVKRAQWLQFTGSDSILTDWERETFTRAF